MFENRAEAGLLLCPYLASFKLKHLIVVALPRGGVPVAFEIAKFFKVPLAVISVRKVGAPGNPELGIGAVAEGGVEVLDYDLIKVLEVSDAELNAIIKKEKAEVEKRIKLYRKGKKLTGIKGADVILVDDGLATGVTAEAAIKAVKKFAPHRVILASPVCARDTVERLGVEVERIVCLLYPFEFAAVGRWYRDFGQLTDRQVLSYLQKSYSWAS